MYYNHILFKKHKQKRRRLQQTKRSDKKKMTLMKKLDKINPSVTIETPCLKSLKKNLEEGVLER